MRSISGRDIRAELEGATLLIPNLHTILSPLSAGSSPQYQRLQDSINSRLDELVKDTYTKEKANRINLPLFVARWWPYSSLEGQEAMALYNLWLFVWDDVFDGEDKKKANPPDISQTCKNTIDYVFYHLGLANPLMAEPAAPTAATSLFQHAGQLLQDNVESAQLHRFFRTVKLYINSCAMEQKYLNSGILPSVQEYWEYRWGTSSVYTGCALAEYMADVKLPEELFDTVQLRTLWLEVNRNTVIVNDLFSLKKEMHGSLQSLIPITMQDTGKGLESVVADIVDELRRSVETFNKTAQELLAMVDGDPDLKDRVEKYIELLQFNLTGNYSWTLECGRYGVTNYLQKDGSFAIPL